jgi:Domain of unknown function (DUF4062)
MQCTVDDESQRDESGMRIYVSSTCMDLRDCGQKVNNAIRCLGHEDVAMEHYVAEPERAVDKRLADITDCHL